MHRSAEGAQGRALVWSGTHVVRCREPMLDERHQACMREIVISGIGLIKHRIARILRTGARGCVLLFVARGMRSYAARPLCVYKRCDRGACLHASVCVVAASRSIEI